MGTESVSRGYCGRGVALTTHLYLAPRLKKEYSYTSTLPLGLRSLLLGEIYFYPLFFKILMKLLSTDFLKILKQNFKKIPPVGAELFQADGRMDRQT